MSLRRVCVLQARTGSTRLPGKVLRDLVGQPMIRHQLRRLTQCKSIDTIVVATTTSAMDDPLASYCEAEGFAVFRGSEANVLDRVVTAAARERADVVVRVTADCPLIDPTVSDRVIDELTGASSSVDYSSNVLNRTYPRGLDTEAMFMDTLMRVHRMAVTRTDREHVTTFIRTGRPDLFAVHSVEAADDESDLRWTVDDELDFELISRLFTELRLAHEIPPYSEVVEYMRVRPELARINSQSVTWEPNGGSPNDATRAPA